MHRTALTVRTTQCAASKGAHACDLWWDINILVWGLLLSKQVLSCQKLSYVLMASLLEFGYYFRSINLLIILRNSSTSLIKVFSSAEQYVK